MPAAERRRRLGAAGLAASAAAVAAFLAVCALGPSVMQPALPGRAGQPPYALAAQPQPVLVVALIVAGICLAAAGLGLCLYAGPHGRRIRPRALLVAGLLAAAAFAAMPPIGSADHLNYAAYGRMAVTGHDPYETAARDLPGDPVARAVERPWQEEPSIYGPIATAVQAFASLVGGSSVRLTIFVLSAVNLVVFAAVGLLLYGAARGDPDRRWRAALLWTANPLVLFHLVAGGHNDTLAIGLAVAATLTFVPRTGRRAGRRTGHPDGPGAGARDPSAAAPRLPGLRRMAATGALVGAGAAVKLQAVLAGAGPGWVALPALLRRLPVLRDVPTGGPGTRTPARLIALLAGVAAVAAPAYALAGPHSFDQVRRASDAVSLATPWHLVRRLLDTVLGVPQWRTVIQLGALALMAVLLWLLLRALPTTWPGTGGLAGSGGIGGPSGPGGFTAGGPGDEAARATAAAALAWLLSAPYALPWYDGLGWALLALLPWSRFDGLLLARTAVLSLAYLPARDPGALRALGMPAQLDWLVTVVRAQVIPWILTAILLALVAACLRRPLPAPALVRSPPAPAERPR